MIRDKDLEVSFCHSAERDIQDWRVPASLLPVIQRTFEVNLAARAPRDVCEGTLRFRHFGQFVVTFHISESHDRVHVTVLHIVPPERVSASAEVVRRLWEVAKVFFPGAQAAEAAVGPRP